MRVYLAGLLALAVGAACAVVFYQRAHMLAVVRDGAAERAEFKASVAAEDVTDAVALTERSVVELAANPGLSKLFTTGPPPPGCSLTFTGAGPFAGGHIDIIDAAGRVRCSSTALPTRPIYGEAPWLDVTPGEPVVVGPVEDPTSNGAALVVAAPVPGLGMVVTFLEVDALEERLSHSLSGPLATTFTIVTGDGADPADLPGGDHITGEAAVPSLGWTVHTAISDETATRDAERLNRELLVILAMCLVILGAVTQFVHRRIARPIQRLNAWVSLAVSGASPDDAVPISGPSEVASLGEAFTALRGEVRAELDRRERSERRYRTLFDANPQPMWVQRLTGEITEVNEAMVARFGWSGDELMAMGMASLIPDGSTCDLLADLQAEGPIRRSGPSQLATREGAVVDCQITADVVDLHGEPGRLVIVEDVTAAIRTERLLQQAQRMESLGQLAGGIAHDFNNVLAVMRNYADFVAEEVAAAVAEDPDRWSPVLADVGHVIAAGDRAAALTGQLLSFARDESAEMEAVDLNAVATGLEEMLRRTLGEQIELSLVPEPELWSIIANPAQMEQVIVNLAVNARHAMPEGGSLVIETANLVVDADQAGGLPGVEPGRYVRLRVSDTGLGMDAEARDRAFEPFFTTKERGSGTGLGLAMVYGSVSRAGGTVYLYSEPGLGTSLSALFPATDDAVDVPAVAAPARAPEGVGTILVVEDDDDLRAVAERILSRVGYEVLSAADGPTALAIAAARHGEIDLLLTDMIMPGMWGSELAERVREIEPAMRVLFMSGYSPVLLHAGASLLVGVLLIDKPFSGNELVEKVRQALDARA
ncbi:MAG: sensor hybrid histidine kinase [Acidimicrobiales bacterium]|nr:sensor hybrid histidine kinase [Acidimicrobiales bacterium]